jgi:hypothetical protein
MSTRLLETCTEMKQAYRKKELCVKLVICKNYTEMHGQQSIQNCHLVVLFYGAMAHFQHFAYLYSELEGNCIITR